MDMDRRNFLKGGLAVGSLVAMGGVAACSPQAKSADTTGSVTVPDSFTDGKWIGRAMGQRDYLTMRVDVSGGDIANISVLRCDDTIGIGSVAAPIMASRILAAKNLDVDTVSGATYTSLAVRKAVSEAIKTAGGNPADYSLGTNTAKTGAAHTETVDAIVVGAGTAGLMTACRLLEAGKKVIVIEKLDIAGGSGNMTYSGIIAEGADMQKNYSLGRYDSTADMNFDAKMKLVNSYTTPANNRFGGQLPYEVALYKNSAPMVNWMQSVGIGFFTMGVKYGVTPVLSPGMYMGGCGYAMQFLADRIPAMGGKLIYGTKLTELIQSNGKVTGIKAEGTDGSTWTINAKAVCMCTGGFAANKDMVAKYYPDYAGFSFNCCPGSTGEGLQMAEKAGAAIECMGRQLGAFNATTSEAAGSRFEIAFIHMFAPGVTVNASGDEFGKGSISHRMLGEAVRDSANGGHFFHVTDHAGATTMSKMDSWASDDYNCLFSRGDVVHYDTVEEAANVLNLPGLASTIETHNEVALSGEKDAFGRACTYINTNEGIWIVSCMPTFYVTTGGIAIDTSGHVLTATGATIPGLYAAGDICGSIEEKDGTMYGYGFDSALTYGYIMGNTVSAEI